MYTQHLTNSILVQEYGYTNVIEMLKSHFKNFENDILRIKSVYSLVNGIIRFDFIVTDENIRNKIKDIEVTLDKEVQKEIYRKYLGSFYQDLLNYLRDEVIKVKTKLELEKPDYNYTIFTSNISIFTYLKNSGILRLEIII